MRAGVGVTAAGPGPRIWTTRAELASAIFEYIEAFYIAVPPQRPGLPQPHRLRKTSHDHQHGRVNTQHQPSGKARKGYPRLSLPAAVNRRGVGVPRGILRWVRSHPKFSMRERHFRAFRARITGAIMEDPDLTTRWTQAP